MRAPKRSTRFVRRVNIQPRRAASIAAMSIFAIVIIASNARLAAAPSGSEMASMRAFKIFIHRSSIARRSASRDSACFATLRLRT